MRRANTNELVELFDTLLQEFLLNGNSILTDHQNILSPDAFQMAIQCSQYQKGKGSFEQVMEKQFVNASVESKLILAHAMWLWCYSVADISVARKQLYTSQFLGLSNSDLKEKFYHQGSGSAGQWHTSNKPEEIRFTLSLLQFLYQKIHEDKLQTIEELKGWIEAVCLYAQYEQDDPNYPLPQDFIDKLSSDKLAVSNIYLFLLNPDIYENIASANNKRAIVSSFFSILPQEIQNDDSLNLDQLLFEIRKELTSITQNEDFTFYDTLQQRVWNISAIDKSFTPIQGLQYKKSIILYGPPGTSKTYSAKELAEVLIIRSLLRDKNNVLQYLQDNFGIDDYIHTLQMHPSYTYEDFIAGYQLENHNTVPTKGSFFRICEAASADLGKTQADDKPHVLILDEINRIDLSRLFGEVFSALENRDQPIEVAIGGYQLTVPRNLYVIGTMNEIDFSLERIDFALRRRFLWYFYGYQEAALQEIISYKNETLNARMKMEEEMERFIHNCTELNRKIDAIPELGQQYQIGHTFFAEIVPIYKQYKTYNGCKSLKKQIFRADGPAQILWEISIEPILSAFLGNLNTEAKAKIIKELQQTYHAK